MALTRPAELGLRFTSWTLIVKLPSREFAGALENEFSMMTLARPIGMDVPPDHLVDVEVIGNLPEGMRTPKGQALAVERFDRLEGAGPVHVEDFAQIFGVYPDEKYKRASYRNIARVIAADVARTIEGHLATIPLARGRP